MKAMCLGTMRSWRRYYSAWTCDAGVVCRIYLHLWPHGVNITFQPTEHSKSLLKKNCPRQPWSLQLLSSITTLRTIVVVVAKAESRIAKKNKLLSCHHQTCNLVFANARTGHTERRHASDLSSAISITCLERHRNPGTCFGVDLIFRSIWSNQCRYSWYVQNWYAHLAAPPHVEVRSCASLEECLPAFPWSPCGSWGLKDSYFF